MTQNLLFICTGNYYRSRTAEELFNYWAREHGLAWVAYSRGLREDMSKSSNVGPMSEFALSYLESLNIPIKGRERMPQSLVETDFQRYHLLICMDEQEHRPMMQQRFPYHENSVEYWQVRDVQFETPTAALPLLKEQVENLLLSLK